MQTVPPFVHKHRVWLHLLLVVGIFVYLYSPLLDHWSGNGHTRPHIHIHITETIDGEIAHTHMGDVSEHGDETGAPEQGVLCLLDLTTQLSILLHFDTLLAEQIVYRASLVFAAVPASLQVSSIHLSSLDPPPRI